MYQKTIFLAFFIGFLFSACNTPYSPKDLRKLTDEELYERARNKTQNNPDVIVKNQKGEIIPHDSIPKIKNPERFAADVYVDEDGVQQEMVIRIATEADLERREKIKELYNAAPEITIIEDIDCSKTKELLSEAFRKDQSTRGDGAQYDAQSDLENQTVVVSIIEKCGFPTSVEHGEESVRAVFFVLQHANHGLMKKYFPQLKASADAGDLEWRTLALMEDRMLVNDGKKQKYGTQVIKKNGNDFFELSPIEAPELVDKRRREIGLGALKDYVSRWNIVFDVEQKE